MKRHFPQTNKQTVEFFTSKPQSRARLYPRSSWLSLLSGLGQSLQPDLKTRLLLWNTAACPKHNGQAVKPEHNGQAVKPKWNPPTQSQAKEYNTNHSSLTSKQCCFRLHLWKTASLLPPPSLSLSLPPENTRCTCRLNGNMAIINMYGKGVIQDGLRVRIHTSSMRWKCTITVRTYVHCM